MKLLLQWCSITKLLICSSAIHICYGTSCIAHIKLYTSEAWEMAKRVMHNPSYTTRHAQSRTGPASPDWRLGGWTFPASISVHTATGTWRLDVYCCGGAAATVLLLLLPYCCNLRLSAICWLLETTACWVFCIPMLRSVLNSVTRMQTV